jgi:hypothetical protein
MDPGPAFTPPDRANGAGTQRFDHYRFKRMNGSEPSGYHNPHLASCAPPEVLAFLKLYGVDVLAVQGGRMFVSKEFPAGSSVVLHGNPFRRIVAANDGPIDAPLAYWQLVCKTLLDYAVQNGYKET